ncbi:hypothetical protein SPI_08705 [Niveomyces insectorum RCEF 264]|uniref:Uncharacterized protein n=1 Tax=Niveomyces insectorum RCEF 264 TaxID=1081102 RepID=A0A167MWF0_9HYPO|nr:hypothetical protein SPI_08705 [Niveomyces insectorum RCEF 264]
MVSHEKRGSSPGLGSPVPAIDLLALDNHYSGPGTRRDSNHNSLIIPMGSPPAGGAGAAHSASSSSLSSGLLAPQHQRLIFELLPFKEPAQFEDWLLGLRGHWDEYCRDYFVREVDAIVEESRRAAVTTAVTTATATATATNTTKYYHPEPDKATTALRAKDALNNRHPQFLAYYPDKTDWTGEDHAVRFVTTVVADSLLRKTWSERDWKKRPLEITRAVYEVLIFERAGLLDYRRQLAALAAQNRAALERAYDHPPEYGA